MEETMNGFIFRTNAKVNVSNISLDFKNVTQITPRDS